MLYPQQVSKGPVEGSLRSGPHLVPGPRRVSPIATTRKGALPMGGDQGEGLLAS